MEQNESILEKQIQEECTCAGKINQMNLRRILSDNCNTEYGIRYHFSQIQTIEDYQITLPLTEYRDYEKAVDRMLAGEGNILTVYQIEGYCRSSGTSSTGRKNIPISDIQLQQYGNSADAYVDAMMKKEGGKRLQLAVFRTKSDDVEQHLLYTEIYYRHKVRCGLMNLQEYVGGEELLFNKGISDVLFAKAYSALLEEKIILIEAIYLYELLHFFSYLEENYKMVLTAIRDSRIPEAVNLSDSVKEFLLSLPVSQQRLLYIEQECEKGFDGIAKRLWPKLRLISGISSRGFFLEDVSLGRYTGDIPKYYYIYCASECYIGNPVAVNDFRYVLVPDKAFFEFLPYDEENIFRETILPQEVQVGALYEVVITNFAGLYRYRMGDIVRITGQIGESPIMEFVMRRNLCLNLAGEKFNLHQMEKALEQLRSMGIPVAMYCFAVSVDKIPGCYLAAFSLADSEISMDSVAEIAEKLDEVLMQQNVDYEDLRQLKEIAPPRVRVFDTEGYLAFMKVNGLSHGHNKPKHIAPNGFVEF